MVQLICILMALAALLTFSDAASIIFLSSAFGAAAAVWILYSILIGKREARITWILAAGLLAGYCGGLAITQTLAGLDQSGVADAEWITVPPSWIAYTLVLVFTGVSALLAAGFLESPLVKEQNVVQMTWKQERFLWFGLIVMAAEVFAGGLGYGGISNEAGTGRVSALAECAAMFVPITMPLATIGALQSSGLRKVRFIFIALAGLLLAFPSGRRVLGYTLLVSAFAAVRLSGKHFHMSFRRKVLVGSTGLIVVAVASFVFLGIRLASDQMESGNHPFSTIVETATRTTFTDKQSLAISLSENIGSRPMLLTQYLSLLSKGGNTPSPMKGQDAWWAIENTVPDVLYSRFGSSKDNIRFVGSEEGLANEHFGLPVFDDANSLFTGGLIDFGFLGVIAYPLIACAIARAMLFVVSRMLNSEGQLVLLLFMLWLFLQSEAELAQYVTAVRDLTMLLAIWAAMYSIPKFTGRRREMPLFSESTP